jgi:polyamine oxidase
MYALAFLLLTTTLAMPHAITYDVIIIGAGASGISAASRLIEEGKKVVVLEGRDRIGGRVHTDTSLGYAADMGAVWIEGPTKRNSIWRLAEYVRALYLTFQYDVERVDGSEDSFKVFGPGARNGWKDEAEEMRERLETTTDAIQGEDQSLRQTIDSMNLSKKDRRVMDVMERTYISTNFAASAENMSSIHLTEDLGTGEEGGVFGQIMPGGYRQIFEYVIAEKDFDIQLNTVIAAIEYDEDKKIVLVTTKEGTEFQAKTVIVTLPLGVLKARTVKFTPALSEKKMAAIDLLGMGNLFKVFLEFPRGECLIPVNASGAFRIPAAGEPIDHSAPYYFLNGGS